MRIVIIIFILSLSLKGIAQRFVEPDKMKSFNITVNFDNYTVKTQMLKDPKKLNANPDLTYCWYTAQKIMETKGGFDGKLIHGYYRAFYLNNQLKESGEYKYGIKNSEWKAWYTDGKLKEITNWKNGVKKGAFVLYNDFGILMATGRFKNNLLHGKFYTYDTKGNITLKQKYKHGVEKIKKQKKNKKTKSEIKPDSTQTVEGNKAPVKEKKKLFNRSKKKVANDNFETKKEPLVKKEKKSVKQKIKSLFKKKPKKEKQLSSNNQPIKA